MEIITSLDWITATRVGDYPEMIVPHRNIELGGRRKHSMAWYNNTYDLIPAGVFSARTDTEISEGLLTLSGSALSAWRRAGWGDNRIMEFLMSVGAECTRLDFAIDIIDGDTDPRELTAEWDAGRRSGSARKISVYDSREDGYTLYIGSRKSDQFIRAYDKAAESGVKGVNWTRIEIQVKKDRAKAFQRDMARSTISEAGRGRILSLVDFTSIEWWNKAVRTGKLTEPERIPKPEPKPIKWLREQVAGVFRKEYEPEEVDMLRHWLLEANENLRSNNPACYDTD